MWHRPSRAGTLFLGSSLCLNRSCHHSAGPALLSRGQREGRPPVSVSCVAAVWATSHRWTGTALCHSYPELAHILPISTTRPVGSGARPVHATWPPPGLFPGGCLGFVAHSVERLGFIFRIYGAPLSGLMCLPPPATGEVRIHYGLW